MNTFNIPDNNTYDQDQVGSLGLETENNDIVYDFSKPHISRDQIQIILNFPFDKEILSARNLLNYRRAFVHKSIQKYVRGQKNIQDYLRESNERLEFLGDSAFGLAVGDYLYNKFPDKDEGFLTRLKSKIVRDINCVKFARTVGIGDFILAGKIVKKDDNGSYNDKLLEDTFEAFIGAIFLDLGFKSCQQYIYKLIEKYVDLTGILEDDNYKDILMRYTQSKGIPLPVYKLVSQEGPPHKRIFTVCVIINIDGLNYEMGKGQSNSKKNAEQIAALNTLNSIDPEDLSELPGRS